MNEQTDEERKPQHHAPDPPNEKPDRQEPAAYGVIERIADRLRDLGLWLMRLVS